MKRPSFARDYGFSAAMTARDVQPRARLDVLFEELRDLFSGAGNTPPVALMGGGDPHIAIRTGSGNISARVTIDAENGLYVFCELDRTAGIVLATASEERLIDEIVAHLSAGDDDLVPRTIDSAVGILVGQTMEDVERKLILQTLRHCSGNLTHTAFMLGISLTALCRKLAVYFPDTAKDLSKGETGVAHRAEGDRR
ncbi:transcriptional regulator [Agrobacterium rhizogenes]|nr:transcriptional regulator [Rhizobium rhizogenes]NTG50168.1 transcriptional regulator [Rhizobium rhizogenes]